MSAHAGGRAGGRAGGGRRRGDHEEEHVNHERWLVSYSDMITVLMALFIVLFAISQVDQEKYIALRESLSAGFQDNAGSDAILDGTAGTLDGQSVVPQTSSQNGTAGMVDADEGLGDQGTDPAPAASSAPAVDPAVLAAAQAEADHLAEIREAIQRHLDKAGLGDAVRFRVDERGLVLGLVADDVFFAAASADLTATARRVLDVAGPTLKGLGEDISVEGHANVLPVSGRYATNWELSADRATRVLRHLVEKDGIAGDRIMAVGFGDERPLVEGSNARALAANRRVDLVILSDAPETVRALLPALSKE